ncbi:hypothetical protein CAPN010_03620 [Capnocytophaga cynodegmi]|uniref:Uncharacterized protein n=1 Tax=Capnocytophaga cynodegmi TaxID=28189 RepID=A0A0B7HD39_9FLAO|nr:hypothetical protein [Capnocytophaga cynodegmi]GJQ06204.1 hypothetical protein CAPN010_03620 [Capnocytophaga cynodegmi]CEN37616.1 hypothetical protein CCYN2B_40156 [Capnocytophaga cynodegmi]
MFKKGKNGSEPTWLIVAIALLVGLIVPDRFNPLSSIGELFAKKGEKKD